MAATENADGIELDSKQQTGCKSFLVQLESTFKIGCKIGQFRINLNIVQNDNNWTHAVHAVRWLGLHTHAHIIQNTLLQSPNDGHWILSIFYWTWHSAVWNFCLPNLNTYWKRMCCCFRPNFNNHIRFGYSHSSQLTENAQCAKWMWKLYFSLSLSRWVCELAVLVRFKSISMRYWVLLNVISLFLPRTLSV